MRRAAVFVGAALGYWVAALCSQGAQQPSPTFRGGIDVVQLDVSVLDKNRQPVKGLTAANFTVLEDGKTQSLVAFDAVDLPDPVEPPARWMRDVAQDVVTNDVPARRIVVIVFDDANIPFDPMVMASAKQTARAVVDRLGAGDLGAVTFTDSGSRQNVTSDRQRLLDAIDSFVPHPGTSAAADALQRAYVAERAALGSGSSGLPPPPCMYRGSFRGQGACVIDTLVNAGRALLSAPAGRKTIVYISAGVPYDFTMTDGRGWQDPADDVIGIQTMLKTLQEANVSVYAIDPSGVTAQGIVGPRLDALRLFAEENGGRATIATNAPANAVPQIFRENSSYYLLGFQSTNAEADGRFRKISVKVNRPDVEVRTRIGYYRPSAGKPKPSARPPAAVSPLDKAMAQSVPGGDLPLGLTAAPFAMRGQSSAALAIAVSLREAPRPGRQTMELVTTAIDSDCSDCKKRESHRQTVEFRLQPGAPSSTRYELLSRLNLPPGRYSVRIAAQLGERTGNVFTDVDVPDFARERLSASGLVLSANVPLLTAQRNLLADVLPMIPIATREFSPGSAVVSFVRFYQGGTKSPATVRLSATIVDDAGQTRFDQANTLEAGDFSRSRSADYQFTLPLSSLKPGAHLLTIDATMGGTSVRRTARFTVR